MAPQRLLLIACLMVGYLTLFFQLGNLAFVGADEPRYARIGEEMLLSGDYVTPHLNARPWLEKPPLLFWMEALSYRLLGISEATARLPVALSALWGALAVAFLADRVAGRRAGFLAFLILITSGMYPVYGRAASTDMPLVACFTSSLVAAFLASRSDRVAWGALSGIFLGLAVLAKGPVALLLFLGIGLLYPTLLGRWPWSITQSLVGTITFLVVGVPWFYYVWSANGPSFVSTFWLNHHLARFLTDIHHHTQPSWYYLPVLLVGFFPWVCFLGSAGHRLWSSRHKAAESQQAFQLFLWIWAAVPFFFFSLGSSKLPGYLLPIWPALAVLVALEWDRFLEGNLGSYRIMKIQLAGVGAFSLVFGVALIFGFHFAYSSALLGGLLSAPLFAAGLWAQYEFQRRRPVLLLLGLVGGISLSICFAFWRAAPVVGSYHSSRELVRVAQPYISASEPLILYRYFHHTAHYYSGYRTIAEALKNPDQLRSYMSRHPQLSYIVLSQEVGARELVAQLGANLIRVHGNLFLLRLESPAEG